MTREWITHTQLACLGLTDKITLNGRRFEDELTSEETALLERTRAERARRYFLESMRAR